MAKSQPNSLYAHPQLVPVSRLEDGVVLTEMIQKRFWTKVDKSGDCWEWTGTKITSGYGHFYIGNHRVLRAHRVAFAIANGRWPLPGLLVCHKCDNPSCVRPDHLFEGTHSDNSSDASIKKRYKKPVGKGNATECVNGHPFTPENTIIRQDGFRRCRICKNMHEREQRRLRRGDPNAYVYQLKSRITDLELQVESLQLQNGLLKDKLAAAQPQKAHRKHEPLEVPK